MLQHDLARDLGSLAPASAFDRRRFVKTALGSGFAAAALPVAATAIRTASAGLDVGEVTIPVGDFRMPAYRAKPAGRSGLPIVLVISEIFGVHEYIADVARRFAHQGYLAIAPELFVRQGDPNEFGELARLLSEVIAKVPDSQVMGDLDASVKWAAANGGDPARLAVTGFCWGGRITWLYAAHQPALKAGVAWYGRLVGTNSALTPRHPVDVSGSLQAPVLGLYGGDDSGIPLDTVERKRAGLRVGSPAARRSDIVVYPGAPHAFHADYRPSYRQEPAEDGWKRCLGWFRTHGVA